MFPEVPNNILQVFWTSRVRKLNKDTSIFLVWF
jgi:hypothetical protein